jgi:hypothetical protein
MATNRSSIAFVVGARERRSQVQAGGRGIEQLACGLPMMDRLGRTVRGAHSGQSRMAGGQFTLWVNIPWCMAERLVATG